MANSAFPGGAAPLDSDLQEIAALNTQAYGRGVLEAADIDALMAMAGLYVGGGGDVDIANLSFIDLVSKAITIVAGESYIMDADILILNNSATARTYNLGFSVGSLAFDIADGATIAASATNRAMMTLRGNIEVRSTSLAYASFQLERLGPAAAGTVSSIAVANHRGAWQTSTANLTGSQTFKFQIRSGAATTVQTATVLGWRIQRA